MPAGLALYGQRLYVAEAGINAVAVIDTAANRVLGHLPVGWYPTAAAVSADGGLLYVVNTKGKGSGPNGGSGFHPGNTGSYVGELEFGSLSVIPLAPEVDLAQATATVIRDNEAALVPDAPLPRLQHVFLIIRENRTYDEILGDLPGSDGDPRLARWGLHGWLANAPMDKTRCRYAERPRVGAALRHQRPLLCRQRCIGRRPPMGDGCGPDALVPHRVDLQLRWPQDGGSVQRRCRPAAPSAEVPMRRCRKTSPSSAPCGSILPMPA